MRFKPRFFIRDLLWLTALVAMGVAWWVNSRQHERYRQHLSYLLTDSHDPEIQFTEERVEREYQRRLKQPAGLPHFFLVPDQNGR